MTGLDVVVLVFLGFLFGVFVGAMGIAFSHDVRMEKRRRAAVAERERATALKGEGAYTAHNPTPPNALELQAPKGKTSRDQPRSAFMP